MKLIYARFEWKLADMWRGLYWDRRGQELHVWVCFIPCVPLHLVIAGQGVR